MSSNIRQRNHVREIGQNGPVILYGHGFGCNQHMWHRITGAFEDTHRQVLFDYVGSGQSDPAAFDRKRYARLDGYTQDMIEVCDTLGLSGITLVAHSVSCNIGMLASIARPDLFERLVLLGPNPCFLNHPPDYHGGFDRADLEGLLSLMEMNYIGWANYLAPLATGAAVDDAVTGTFIDSFCSTDPVMARTFAEATFFADHRADLARVTKPCLILQHSDDALVPVSVGDYLHRELRGSQLELLDVKGHSAHMSQPELVIAAMQRYLPSA
jgi:sigma-B regulation protein RsbQ